MPLSDIEILDRLTDPDPAKRLVITPIISTRQFQPSSFDLRLGNRFKVIRNVRQPYFNPLVAEEVIRNQVKHYLMPVNVREFHAVVIHPGEFALGSTFEYIKLPLDIAADLEGKSTWGRLGLKIHSTAGFVDPGFKGRLTFEIENGGNIPIVLIPGLRVAQLCFQWCQKPSARAYGSVGADSKYQYQLETTASRFFKDSELAFFRKKLQSELASKLNLHEDDVQAVLKELYEEFL
jgi:dCTP deaminase